MSSGNWIQHLFSAKTRTATGGLDGFHTLTNKTQSDFQFTDKILNRDGMTTERSAAFIIDCGDRWYIGADGTIGGTLGENHPHAHEQPIKGGVPEKGRRICFVHGYFAPKSEKIPDLDELLARHPKDLEEILRRANSGEDNIIADKVKFTQPRKSGTDWDKIATEFENGTHKTEGMTFKKNGEKFHPVGEKLECAASWTSKITAGKAALIGGGLAAVAGLGYIAYQKMRGDTKNFEQTAQTRS